jgi:hypothetical protein
MSKVNSNEMTAAPHNNNKTIANNLRNKRSTKRESGSSSREGD